MKLSELPDFPALKQLADSLWQAGDTRGAAIMIGAGFSRNAILPSPISKKPPLWGDFVKAMSEKLYPNENAPSDPLRLAQEYLAAYKLSSLEGLIRSLVPDEQWNPGELHQILIDLPWSDILTTNWDTLLERASENSLLQNYEVVYTPTDIARTRPPRIVKLHGSLPSHTPFIFTEDDYRTYPVKFSPFVNLVRQVLLENDLCLIGFSGDDPNFIQWTGWIRDELGASARQIFLIGLLNLTPAQRQYYELRHITPIDLSLLFNQEDQVIDPHSEAIRYVLDFFRESKPKLKHQWPDEELEKKIKKNQSDLATNTITLGKNNNAYSETQLAAQRVRDQLNLFKELRSTYPGWLICPSGIRRKIRYCIDAVIYDFPKAFEYLESEDSASILYELAWAHNIAYQPILDFLLESFNEVVEGQYSSELTIYERSFVALVLLRTARENSDSKAYIRWEKWLQVNQVEGTEICSQLIYEQCIKAQDELNFGFIEQNLSKISGADPVWNLRCASMHAGLGSIDSAKSLIRQATKDLQGRLAKDKNSIWILSRLAWAAFLSSSLIGDTKNEKETYIFETGDWPTFFQESKSDPWDEFRYIEHELNDAINKLRNLKRANYPKFDPGNFSDQSTTLHFQSNVVPINYELHCLINNAGIPMSLGYMGLTIGYLQLSLELESWCDIDAFIRNLRILSRVDKKVFDQYLGRIDVARLPMKVVSASVKVLREVIAFGEIKFRSGEGLFWVERVRASTELLSRLVVRLSIRDAKDVFIEASHYLSNSLWNHWWLYENLGHLIRRSLEAIPPEERALLVLDILGLPLHCERNINDSEHYWPEISCKEELKYVDRTGNEGGWKKRVSELIGIVESDESVSRKNAVLRLTYLHLNNLLSDPEKKLFADALWSQQDNNAFPKNTSLLPHVFLELPEPTTGDSEHLFRQHFFEKFDSKFLNSYEYIITIKNVARLSNDLRCTPSVEQATVMLSCFINRESPTKISFFNQSDEEDILLCIGGTLADSILPAFDSETWPSDMNNKLVEWIENDKTPSSLEVLPALVNLDETQKSFAEAKLRRCLASRQSDVVSAALSSVTRWITLIDQKPTAEPLPSSLVRAIIGKVVNRKAPNLHFAIDISESLVTRGLLNADEIEMLIDALEDLFNETSYINWDETHPETHSLTFVRISCILLSKALIAAGHDAPQLNYWIEDTKTDPVPEVRFVNA
ncbi:MAG: hypothetical protein GQ583_10625 [Methyloprofundus sp.]|nr:hypothetical protein [Methyloprofundus sp.]